MICSFNVFFFFLAVCLNISTVLNIKILTNSNQQTQSYEFTSHIAAFLSVVLITEMLEICIHTSYDQNVQLILKSYLPVVYGIHLSWSYLISAIQVLTTHCRFYREQLGPAHFEANPVHNVQLLSKDSIHIFLRNIAIIL